MGTRLQSANYHRVYTPMRKNRIDNEDSFKNLQR